MSEVVSEIWNDEETVGEKLHSPMGTLNSNILPQKPIPHIKKKGQRYGLIANHFKISRSFQQAVPAEDEKHLSKQL
jgi:hypothetical protein